MIFTTRTAATLPLAGLLALASVSVVQGSEEVSVELCVDDPTSAPEDHILLGTWSKPPPDAYVLVGFTVTKAATVRDVTVIEKAPEFLPTGHAIEYVKRFTYDPRVVDGEAIEVPSVQHIIRYLARLVDDSSDQPVNYDADRCFRVPNDPYWRRALEE